MDSKDADGQKERDSLTETEKLAMNRVTAGFTSRINSQQVRKAREEDPDLLNSDKKLCQSYA